MGECGHPTIAGLLDWGSLTVVLAQRPPCRSRRLYQRQHHQARRLHQSRRLYQRQHHQARRLHQSRRLYQRQHHQARRLHQSRRQRQLLRQTPATTATTVMVQVVALVISQRIWNLSGKALKTWHLHLDWSGTRRRCFLACSCSSEGNASQQITVP